MIETGRGGERMHTAERSKHSCMLRCNLNGNVVQ